jgi:hypothetical protein
MHRVRRRALALLGVWNNRETEVAECLHLFIYLFVLLTTLFEELRLHRTEWNGYT